MPLYQFNVSEWWNRVRILPNGTGNQFLFRYLSPFIRTSAYWYPYKEWCIEHHPELTPTKCSSVYLFLKDKDELDVFETPNMIDQYSDRQKALDIQLIFDYVFKYGFYIGLFLYIFKIDLVRTSNMPMLFFVLNCMV